MKLATVGFVARQPLPNIHIPAVAAGVVFIKEEQEQKKRKRKRKRGGERVRGVI